MTFNDYICKVLSDIMTDRYGKKVTVASENQKELTTRTTADKDGEG